MPEIARIIRAMDYLDLTLPTPEENLACDEALLDLVDAGQGRGILRVWESPDYFVVLGYSRPRHRDVHLAACRAAGIPVLRRYTGGGTVLQGPGCLNFTLAVPIRPGGPFATIAGTNRFVAARHQRALAARLHRPVQHECSTDLALDGRKFSGNAQRRRRRAVLFHGTLLYAFDLALICRYLPVPAHQPAYRRDRAHEAFLMNLPLSAETLKDALRKAWQARTSLPDLPSARIQALAQTRYALAEWNGRFP